MADPAAKLLTGLGQIRMAHRVDLFLQHPDAALITGAIRTHRGIENGMRHVLDISFHEDQSRVRKGHSAENLSRLRRISPNLLKVTGDKLGKRNSIKGRRKIVGWDQGFLLGLITD